jgi:TolB protein
MMARITTYFAFALLASCITAVVSALLIGTTQPTYLIVYESVRDRSADIYVMDVERRLTWNLTRHPASDSTPAWTNDGSAIVFYSNRDGNDRLYMIAPSGGSLQRIDTTWEAQWLLRGSLSPDGTRVIYEASDGTNFDIYMMNVDGSEMHRVAYTYWNEYTPRWSPDGSQIIFTLENYVSGEANICIIGADGENPYCLTTDPLLIGYWTPAWSPDGRWIVYQREGNLYVMDASGQNHQQLTYDFSARGRVSWQP